MIGVAFFVSTIVLLASFVLGIWWLLSRQPRSRTAIEILDERLARGELSLEEHQERLAVLRPPRSQRPVGRVGLVLAALGLTGMVGSTIAAAAAGWSPMRRMMEGTDGMDGMMGGGMMDGSTGRSAPDPAEDATAETVVASEFRFHPPEVDVQEGAPVNLVLENEGRAFHTLTIPELEFELRAAPGDRVAGSLEDAEPGRYSFLCAVPGHEAAGMTGTLIVHGPS